MGATRPRAKLGLTPTCPHPSPQRHRPTPALTTLTTPSSAGDGAGRAGAHAAGRLQRESGEEIPRESAAGRHGGARPLWRATVPLLRRQRLLAPATGGVWRGRRERRHLRRRRTHRHRQSPRCRHLRHRRYQRQRRRARPDVDPVLEAGGARSRKWTAAPGSGRVWCPGRGRDGPSPYFPSCAAAWSCPPRRSTPGLAARSRGRRQPSPHR